MDMLTIHLHLLFRSKFSPYTVRPSEDNDLSALSWSVKGMASEL